MTNINGTAVVTGASAGIGKVYADRLAQRGYDLLLIARRAELLAEYADSLKSKCKVAVRTMAADLSREADLTRVETAIGADESISLLINNAGTATLAPSLTINGGAREAMTDLNVTAVVRLSLAVLAGFKERNRGTLINIGSTLGFHPLPISSLYSGTKGYVLNFTRGLQEELAATKIVVQLVLPAATATDLWEISGVPLSALDPAHVMSVEDCVDAALAGLDLGEKLTMPSLEDNTLLAKYDAARLAMFAASQSGTPATRYLRSLPRVANSN
jgi:short-subunit dehydrogenase